jgi:hypothetical protein
VLVYSGWYHDGYNHRCDGGILPMETTYRIIEGMDQVSGPGRSDLIIVLFGVLCGIYLFSI